MAWFGSLASSTRTPPSCSLVSATGPSVMATLPRSNRSVVAVPARWSALPSIVAVLPKQGLLGEVLFQQRFSVAFVHRVPRLFFVVSKAQVFHGVLQFIAKSHSATMIIHDTPNRSATMPNREEKKVLASGMQTFPPLLSAVNSRSASASFDTGSDRAKPWKFGRPRHWPSEAITVESPMRRLACITLFSAPGGTMPGGWGSGLSLNRISMVTSAPSVLL